MKNYFLPKIEGLTLEVTTRLLSVVGVEYCEMEIDGHVGVVVDEGNIESALRGTGMSIVTETETSLEGIVKVQLVEAEIVLDEEEIDNISSSSAGIETEEDRRRRLAEEQKKESRQQYMAECSRRFEKTVKGTRQKIETGHREIEELQKQLTRKIRETRGAERKLEQLNASAKDQLESYGREFDSLSAVPGVEDVQVSDGVIKVLTEHIYITPDGHSDTFDIGKFRMEIYTSGANGGVKFFNLTRKGSGGGSSGYNIHHPHVDSGGSPCLGNIKELVSQLIGEYEYSAVAQLGLQYLKSVNTNDSAGRGIFNAWPKKEEK